ncbi:MAG: sugar nucleotide-binding protein [Phycisphaerales bacterium]
MRYLLTGMNGTVAPALARMLRARGDEVIAWDRAAYPTDTEAAVMGFIGQTRPDWVCHIATGAPAWAQWIARACAAGGPKLLWTSTVSIYADATPAPLGVEAPALASDDYGKYKAETERLVREACPGALVPRLGWQIGSQPGSNTMTDFLFRTAKEKDGVIEASAAWIPSTAWLDDTADAMLRLMDTGATGPYQLEGNAAGMTFFDLATAIARRFNAAWRIVRTETPRMDRRMHDPRVTMGQVRERLK